MKANQLPLRGEMYHATCSHCGRVIERLDEYELEEEVDRHLGRCPGPVRMPGRGRRRGRHGAGRGWESKFNSWANSFL